MLKQIYCRWLAIFSKKGEPADRTALYVDCDVEIFRIEVENRWKFDPESIKVAPAKSICLDFSSNSSLDRKQSKT